MLLRVAIVCAFVVGAASAVAEELAPEQARAFVVGKLFSYTCFDGTAGMGRIFSDGSVVGTIRPGGQSQVRFAALPAGTIKVSSNAMCAHLAGLPIEPCFRVQKLDYHSFRGSISGLSFAYCDFYQRNPRSPDRRRQRQARHCAGAGIGDGGCDLASVGRLARRQATKLPRSACADKARAGKPSRCRAARRQARSPIARGRCR